MARPRLKKGDITLREMYLMSKDAYSRLDDKERRMTIDIKRTQVTYHNNMRYNRSTKQWDQVGRDVKIVSLVQSIPTSYKKQDTVAVHKYPVTFLIHDINAGLDSSFKWRTGSLRKPKFPKKGDSKKKRLQIINDNIRNGIQLQVFFELEWVATTYQLWIGPNRTNRPPIKTNPGMEIFFDKEALYVFENTIIPLLTTLKGKLLNKSIVNKEHGKG